MATEPNHLLWCLAVSMLLVGCSDGGSGGSGQAVDPDVIVATWVSDTTPAPNASGVARDIVLMATFDRDILTTSVDDRSFTLSTDAGPATGTVSFDGNTNVARFAPATPLPLLATATATLTTAIADLSGNTMPADHRWRFTTEDGAWGTAEAVESALATTSHPQVAVAADGSAVAVWAQSAGGRNDIWANRYVPGSGWGSAELIETDNAGTASRPQVAIDPGGNVVAVWHQSDGTRDNIWANRHEPGVGWGSAERLEFNDAGAASSPRIAMDSDGNALVVWYQDNGVRNNIYASRHQPGAGWSVPEIIDNNTGGTLEPQLAMTPVGDAIAVWRQWDGVGVNYSVWASYYLASSGWETPQLLETGSEQSHSPHIALDPDGNAVAVWGQDDGLVRHIWAAVHTRDAGWAAAELIEADVGSAFRPQVAMDGNGNAWAVWYQDSGGVTSIWRNHYDAGTGWGTAQLLETDDSGDARDVRIASDPSGNALAVWYQSDGAVNSIWSSRFAAGSGWGAAAMLEEDNSGHATLVQVICGSNGQGLAIWQQFDGATTNILANRFE